MESNSEIDLGNSFIDGNVEESTKTQYTRKIAHFEDWLKCKHPQVVLRGYIDYKQIDNEIMKECFGHVSKKRDREKESAANPYIYLEPVKFQSFEHVSGYKSAIVYKFKKESIHRSQDFNAMTADLFAGYKRKVAKLKKTVK